MNDYRDWLTMRDLDQNAGLPKGSAFRCFKRLRSTWSEGVDFVVLDHRRNGPLAASLHARDRLYRSSIHPVLLAPTAAEALRLQLATDSGRRSN